MRETVTQFKDTAAFDDFQGMIGKEIAGIFSGRLKEFGVPDDDRLRMLADEICYDIASVMSTVGDFELPASSQLEDLLDADEIEKTDEIDSPEPGLNAQASLEEKTDEIDLSEPDTNDLALLEEKTDEIDLPEPDTNDLALQEEKTDEIDLPEPGISDLALLAEKTDEIDPPESIMDAHAFLEELTGEISLMSEETDNHQQIPRPAVGVLSQEEVLKLLNDAKTAAV